VANTIPNAHFPGGQVKTIRYVVEQLAAGADIAERAIASFVRAGHIVGARIVNAENTASAIDDSNTAVVVLQVGATAAAAVTFATVTYNTANAFPGANIVDTGLTFTESEFPIVADDIITLQVTQGTNADLPALWTVEVDYVGG